MAREKKKFLVDVGMKGLPFPMRVASRQTKEGQETVATIDISARIMREFEARWIDTFIKIVHDHRARIGTSTLADNIFDYLLALHATMVKVEFHYPFFMEKLTPVSRQQCLVRYLCGYSAKVSSIQNRANVTFAIEVPVITTYPVSGADKPGGLFGQLSVVTVKTMSHHEIFPEEIVALVDSNALAPVYSYLSEEDQHAIIERVHTLERTSVETIDAVKNDLARMKNIEWYSVESVNYGMLHTYGTFIGIEKSPWVPLAGMSDDAL